MERRTLTRTPNGTTTMAMDQEDENEINAGRLNFHIGETSKDGNSPPLSPSSGRRETTGNNKGYKVGDTVGGEGRLSSWCCCHLEKECGGHDNRGTQAAAVDGGGCSLSQRRHHKQDCSGHCIDSTDASVVHKEVHRLNAPITVIAVMS